jgi:hypothetical protein
MFASASRGKAAPAGPVSYSNTTQLQAAVRNNVQQTMRSVIDLLVSCLEFSMTRALNPAGGYLSAGAKISYTAAQKGTK